MFSTIFPQQTFLDIEVFAIHNKDIIETEVSKGMQELKRNKKKNFLSVKPQAEVLAFRAYMLVGL